jgi:hypothetical protein
MWQEFEKYLKRHGEIGLQAILENWERYQGIKHHGAITLAERWVVFYRESDTQVKAA